MCVEQIEESTLTINKNHKKKLSLMETRVQLAEKSHNLELERNHHVNSLLVTPVASVTMIVSS